MPRQWLGLFIAFVLVMGADISALAEWKPEAETLVVYNKNYPESESLARYYAEKRHIPAEHSKTGKPHIVFLSRQAVALFRELRALWGATHPRKP